MKIRRLNNKGMEVFRHFLDSLHTEKPEDLPVNILDKVGYTEEIDGDLEVEKREFPDRLSVGKYLYELFEKFPELSLERDKGLWAWLSLFYFEQLCPLNKSGSQKPGNLARWIPEVSDFRKYYRHLLAGPFRIYRIYHETPEIAMSLLSNPPGRPGEVVEQIASRQELVTNRSIVELATKLYHNPRTGKMKKGAGGKNAGSVRRLADFLNQLDLTWDLYSMDCISVFNLLPNEFSKFK